MVEELCSLVASDNDSMFALSSDNRRRRKWCLPHIGVGWIHPLTWRQEQPRGGAGLPERDTRLCAVRCALRSHMVIHIDASIRIALIWDWME